MNKERWLSVNVLALCFFGMILIAWTFEMQRSYEKQLYVKQTEINLLNDLYNKSIDRIELLNELVEVENK